MLGVGRYGPLGPVMSASASHPEAGPGTGWGSGAPGRESRLDPQAPPAAPAPAAAVRDPRRSEHDAWTALASVDGLGPVSFGALVRAFGSASAVLGAAAGSHGTARLVAAAGTEGLALDPEVAAAIGRAGDDAPAILARIGALGLATITIEEDAYPTRLRRIEVPPPVLFVHGDTAVLETPRPVAIVGTRRPTDDGRRTAARLAGSLAASGATVLSGLAIGIDGAAHAGALQAGGTTVAVLGSGHARLYPRVHAGLAAEIVRTGGAVIAELPPDTPPRPAGFPRRNRIIAGLSDATLVVEAGARSGALITASWALEQGRRVFVVPGPIERPQSVGCNRLLRTAAGEVSIVAGADELIEDLGYGVPVATRARRPRRSESQRPDAGAILARLGAAEAAVARCLLRGPATADDLATAADLAPATVLAVLTRLEEEGLVAGALGRYRTSGPLADLRLVRGSGRERGGVTGSGERRRAGAPPSHRATADRIVVEQAAADSVPWGGPGRDEPPTAQPAGDAP